MGGFRRRRVNAPRPDRRGLASNHPPILSLAARHVSGWRCPASGPLKGFGIGGGYRYSPDRYLSRVRQNAAVVSSPFVDYWQPPAKTLAIFSKYGFKIGQRDAWVQFNADNLLKTKKYINEPAFTNLLIYPIETSVVWRVTSGIRF